MPAFATEPTTVDGERALVILPTYNERENLALLVRELHARMPAISILVVDDASPDGTGDLADSLASTDERIHVLHRSGKRGLGTAYVEGFRWALARDFEYMVEMDADFSHRPEELPALLSAALDHDLVIGSRNIPGGAVVGWSRIRQLISRGGSWYARLLLGLPVYDCTSGFKCFRRATLQSIDFDRVRSNGYAFQVEVNHACARAGLSLAEVPIIFPERKRGKSKMSTRIVFEAALVVLKLRLGLTAAAVQPAERRSTAPSAG